METTAGFISKYIGEWTRTWKLLYAGLGVRASNNPANPETPQALQIKASSAGAICHDLVFKWDFPSSRLAQNHGLQVMYSSVHTPMRPKSGIEL